MKKIIISLMAVLTVSTTTFANTFNCYDPNNYDKYTLVNGNTGTTLYFEVFNTTLYRHGTGANGESIYVDESGVRKIHVKFINDNLTFIKLFKQNEIKVILSCEEN